MLKRRHNGNRGLSLVELIVATGVLAVTMTSLIAFFINTSRLHEEARNLSQATSHVETVLEDIVSVS